MGGRIPWNRHSREKVVLRIYAAILFAALLSGCAIISDKKFSEDLSQAWVGKTVSEVIALEKRPPARVINIPDGTALYIWSQDTGSTTNVSCWKNDQGSTRCTGRNNASGLCEITAQASSTGIVTSVFTTNCLHFKTGEYRYR